MKKGFHKISVVLSSTLALTFLFLTFALPEDITITTYYPAPFGVYNELRSKKMAIGDTYYDSSQHCWPGGPCSFPDIDANTNLIVEGNVGIGTAGPARKLHVEGGGQISLLQSGSVATDSQAGLYWHTANGYGIYRTPGAWTANTYRQLKIDWPTGIILDPGTGNNAGYDKSYVEITGGKGLRVTQGNVGIGTASPSSGLKLDVEGKVGATHYCDQNGNNCLSADGWSTQHTGCYEKYTGAWNTWVGCNAGYVVTAVKFAGAGILHGRVRCCRIR